MATKFKKGMRPLSAEGSVKKRKGKRNKKKANARSPDPLRGRKVETAPPEDNMPSEAEVLVWRAQIIEAADRIVPFELRADFTYPTLTRINRNVTQALAFWTEDAQRCACVEEMAELTQLLMRQCNQKEASKEDIQEEIADVYITLAQMARIYFSGKIEFNQVVNKKLAKQEEKLNAARAHLTA